MHVKRRHSAVGMGWSCRTQMSQSDPDRSRTRSWDVAGDLGRGPGAQMASEMISCRSSAGNCSSETMIPRRTCRGDETLKREESVCFFYCFSSKIGSRRDNNPKFWATNAAPVGNHIERGSYRIGHVLPAPLEPSRNKRRSSIGCGGRCRIWFMIHEVVILDEQTDLGFEIGPRTALLFNLFPPYSACPILW